MKTITKETFEKFNNEKERLFQHLEKLIDIGLSLDKENEVIDSDWSNTFIDFSVEKSGIFLHFEYPDHDYCGGFIPNEAIGDEETFKKWLLNSIQKKKEIEERKKQLRKEVDEARKIAKIKEKNENKRKHLFEDLGNLEYQRYANIEFYGYTENSKTIKELDNLIKQKREQLKEQNNGNKGK